MTAFLWVFYLTMTGYSTTAFFWVLKAGHDRLQHDSFFATILSVYDRMIGFFSLPRNESTMTGVSLGHLYGKNARPSIGQMTKSCLFSEYLIMRHNFGYIQPLHITAR